MMELQGGACGLWSSLPYFRVGKQVMRRPWAVDKVNELSSVEQLGAMSLTTAQRGHCPWGTELGSWTFPLDCGNLVVTE